MLSLDLCNLVASYVLYSAARSNAKPKRLFAFGQGSLVVGGQRDTFRHICNSIAVNPKNDHIWTAFGLDQVQVFDEHGKFLSYVLPAQHAWLFPVSIAFDNDEVFVADCSRSRVVVCGPSGNFVRAFDSLLPACVVADGKGLLHWPGVECVSAKARRYSCALVQPDW